MTDTLLTAAGIPHRQTRWSDPPPVTYALYMDDVDADGADGINLLRTHHITVELYEPEADEAKEAALEAQLDEAGIPWTKQARYWLQSIKRYQTVYEFDYIEKVRA